jgi:hypothetical protein
MMPSRTILQRTILAGAALAALGLAVAAGAADPAPTASPGGATGFEEEFKRADTNKDGKLSKDEAMASGFFTSGSFNDVDQDHDGTVTLFELGDALQKRLRQWSSSGGSADTDGDGYVSEEEARAAGPSFLAMFKREDVKGEHRVRDEQFEIGIRTWSYSETRDRGVVPNIINKKF